MRLIDADATRKLFDENLIGVCHDVVIKVIDEAPTIEPKRGEWQKVMNTDGVGHDYRCSACRHYRFHNGEMLKKYNFCPNCGADMRKESE